MLLSARILENVANVNSWDISPQASFTQGDQLMVYIQLIDANKDTLNQRFNPPGRRFVPDTGATLQITIQNIDASKTLVKTATQPFPGDSSIWSFQILASDNLGGGTFTLKLALTQGGIVTNGYVLNALRSVSTTQAYC